MFPILYEQITAGVVPAHNGLGVLSDAIICESERIANSKDELVFEYPITGIHAQEIAIRRVVKVKVNPTGDPQLFRIKRISKVMNGKFTVYCKHISYDLSGYEITSGTANSATSACTLLQNNASGFTIDTDKSVSAEFKIDTPASVRSYFGGRTGSFLDVFGKSEIVYDNFHVSFKLHAGQDRGVQIRYAKNLLELSQEMEGESLYSHVLCYWKKEDVKVVGNKVATGLTLDVPATLILDCSSEFDTEPTVSDLTTYATDYISSHNLTTPTNNIKLDFVQSGELANRVDLFDTVSIFYEALGIVRESVQCVRVKYDCLKEKYIETEFGDLQTDLAETIAINNKEIAEKPSTTVMEQAINFATALITGNLGGYVINGHDTNGDGIPDENLIMDTDDINTATKVIRSNLGGVGFSKNGYAGPYQTAIGFDGIVADAITTGTLNADLIKAGVIEDVTGKSSIDMLTGIARLWKLVATHSFTVEDDTTSEELARIFADSNGSALRLRNRSGNTCIIIATGGNRDGYIDVYDGSGNITASIVGQGGKVECDHVVQRSGVVTLFDGTEYSENRVPFGDYNMFAIYGKLSATGSLIPMVIPTAMITTSAQKFITNDDTDYATYNIWHDDQTDELVVRWNTASQTAHQLNKIYGVY